MVTQEATIFIKGMFFLLLKPYLAIPHLNIFHSTLVEDPSVHVFILFLQGIWVMVGQGTEVFTTPARFGERVD